MPLQRLPDGRIVDVPQTGLIGSEQALQQGLGGALSAIGRGADVAGAELQPFAAGGGAAFDLQAAQSGALGPEAQRRAFAEFTESPGQEFLRQRGEQALLRNAAAIGGLGGGNVREELLRRGVGFAAQDFGDQFNRLGGLSNIGLTAATGRAGIAERAGGAGAGAILGTGRDIAGGRTRAGEGIAGEVGRTGTALADLISRGGEGASGILSRGTGNLAELLAASGAAAGTSKERLAELLANISTGSASQRAALPGLPTLQSDPGILARLGKAAEGVGTAFAASDERLKKNITKVGKTPSGLNLYTWDWNAAGRKLTGKMKGAGVIAQEIMKIIPDAVVEIGGWFHVDYGKVV